MTTNRISAAVDSVYRERPPFSEQKDRGDEMSAEWSIPLHRCHRRISRLREQLPEHHDLLIVIWRDMLAAIEATRLQVRKHGIDTSNPLRRKPAAGNPEETRTEPSAIPEETRTEPKATPEETRTEPSATPEETRTEPSANPEATRPSFPQNVIPSSRPVRRTIASALVRLAAAICPTSDLRPLTSASSPVAPPNETPKGPTE